MNTLECLAVAVALAMDAFAVAIATGIRLREVSPRQTFRLAFHLCRVLSTLLNDRRRNTQIT